MTRLSNIRFDFENLSKVMDLIYYDGPLLSLYANPQGDYYLFYWVDVNESANKWLLFRVHLSSIQSYIDKTITLKEIINNPCDDIIYEVVIDVNGCQEITNVFSSANIDPTIIPCDDSYYVFDENIKLDLPAISQKYQSGVLEIRLTGGGINYGTIPLNHYAQIVPQVEEIRKELASKIIDKKKQSLTRNKIKTVKAWKEESEYDYALSLAGSFRFILKPRHVEYSMLGESFSDAFAKEIVSIFESGLTQESVQHIADDYGYKVVKKYKDLISYMNQSEISVGINWCNNLNKISSGCEIKNEQMPVILQNIANSSYAEEEDIRGRGKFYSLNIKTGAYAFEAAEEGDDFKTTGHLDSVRLEVADTINFSKIYDIVVKRKRLTSVSRNEKYEDTIISFIEYQE